MTPPEGADCGSCWTFEHERAPVTTLAAETMDGFRVIMREAVGWLVVVIMFHVALTKMLR